jgi:predicted TIM-barrel fold metal-dependent hydrolase
LILAQEVPRDDDGVEMNGVGAFFVPNDYVLALGRKHPEFVPAVSIHPSRPDALDELEKCLDAGARVMKCLPNCQNIDCNDARYTGFWTRMSEAGMLLLAHTGGEMSLPVVRPEYADPRTLRLPLELGVTVIAAHCAGRSCLYNPDYTDVLIEMFRRYPNLHGDNSALCSPIRSRTIKKIFRAGIADRIIHGSDFPIPVSGLGPALRGRVKWRDHLVARRESNVLERDYRLKKAMGFPESSFTLLDELIFRSAENERKK